ncbi:hypothetical protein PCE1_002943 [Barthelona sp. PCE]
MTTVTLVAEDGTSFTLTDRELLHARSFTAISSLEDHITTDISAFALSKCVEALKFYHSISTKESSDEYVYYAEKAVFEAEFIAVTNEQLFDMVLSASKIEFESMLEVCTAALSKILETLSIGEIRDLFGVEDDFSPEEKQQVEDELAALGIVSQ